MNVQIGGHLDDVPGAGLPVVGEVHVVLVVEEAEADLVPGEGPGAELHDAGLLVEGEIGHVNCAGGLKYFGIKIFSNGNIFFKCRRTEIFWN